MFQTEFVEKIKTHFTKLGKEGGGGRKQPGFGIMGKNFVGPGNPQLTEGGG